MGNGKQKIITLPLRSWDAFSIRAWEGFRNRWNNILLIMNRAATE